MKKFAFSVQVFGIIALFPLYVVLEMNHGTGKPNKNQPLTTARIERTAIRVSFHSEPLRENSIRLTYLWSQDLPLAIMK